MTTAKDEIPVQDPLFLLPPPPGPGPERKKLAQWHIAVLIVGVPILAFLSCVGANTVAHHFIDAPAVKASDTAATHKAKASPRPTATGPHYDLAGYREVLNGTQAQAFIDALGKLRSDAVRSNFTSAVSDAPRLIQTADTWLAMLRKTNPPPSYGAGKVQYLTATIMARRAARTIQQGLQTVNLGLLQRGSQQIAKARWLLHRANAPQAQGS